MNLNFREALVTLSRALPLVLFRAGVFVAGGFMVIIFFGMLLIASRLAAGSGQVVAVVITFMVVLGWWVSDRILQRFFLYRQRAAMLLAFSGGFTAAAGMAATIAESTRLIPDYPCWKRLNRALRPALYAFIRGGEAEFQAPPAIQCAGGFARFLDLLAMGSLGQAVLALAFARGGTDGGRSVRESVALYFAYGMESRRLGRKWLLFSTAGLLFLFLCLAVPNWFFFSSVGAPLWIGVVLAAAIARLLHQAFIAPFVLAGLSAALLAETRGHVPDPELCEKLTALFPASALACGR
ncbi:MAG TPA: hypothetical protein VF451_00450 [Acidobacteriota bacterium]